MSEEAAGSVAATTTPTLEQYLNISNYMYYGQTLTYAQSGLEDEIGLRPLMRGGKPVEVLNEKTGLFAEAFVSTGTGPKQIVIGYEGTSLYKFSNEFTGAQAYDDAAIYAGRDAVSFKGSARFARQVIAIGRARGIGRADIFLTGHSLGAAEAEYAGLRTGLAGTTFGTPGIALPTAQNGSLLHGRQSKLTNYVNYGDPVANYASDGLDPYGSFLISSKTQHYGGATYLGDASNQSYLTNAVSDLQSGDTSDALKGLATAAVFFHPLAGYAFNLSDMYPDQNIQLYQLDGSGDAGTAFVGSFAQASQTASSSAAAPLCFVTGTRIRVGRGHVAVEDLVVGDLAVTVTGARRPIRWIGRRAIDCRADAGRATPVRVAAHAFGEGCPTRDLRLSPGHPVLVGADEDGNGGHLVPIMCLINGTTIERVDVASVTYWHIELDGHDVLIAEGLPAESYLEMGDRSFFAGGEVGALADPDLVAPDFAGRCRPVALEGPVVEAERRRLDAVFAMRLAAAAAWPSDEATDAATA